MTYRITQTTPDALRLHYNENTSGCSPAVVEALRTITAAEIARYPDPSLATRRAADWLRVPPDWVHLTNGLDEGLLAAALHASRSRTEATAEVIVLEPAFEMYGIFAESAGARVIRVAPRRDFTFSVDEVVGAIGPATRLIFLADPNNPTGRGIPAGAVDAIARAAAHALVFVDEAYADFSGRSVIGRLLDERRTVVVGRTFAKAHGLAGLRVGALVAHPETLEPLRRLLPPFSLNVAALRALIAALDDRAHVDWYVAQSRASRERVYAFCRAHGLTCWPSEGNFVLCRMGGMSPAIVAGLRDRSIAVRDKSAAPGCEGCIRITAGVVEHTVAALAAMEELLAARAR